MYKDLFKSFIIYGIGSSISKLIGLFLVPIYTRIFSTDLYGVIDIINTITTIFCIFGMMLLETSIQRYYYEVKDDYDRKKYISTAFFSILLLSFIWVSVIFLFSRNVSIFLFKDEKYYLAFIIASFIIPISNLHVLLTVIIRYMKKPLIYIIFITLQLLTTAGVSIWLVVFAKAGVLGVFIGQLSGFLGTLIIMVIYLRKSILFYWNKKIVIKLFKFSLPMVPAKIGSLVNTYANRFVMLSYLSMSDIGIFTIALKIASAFQILHGAFQKAWYPFFYEQLKKEGHKAVYKKSAKFIWTLIFLFVILFSMFSKEILIILTTEAYYEAAPLIRILIFVFALEFVNSTICSGLLITKKTIYATYTYIFSAIVNLSVLFLLVPEIGLIGVPLSLILSNVCLVVTNWFISEKLYYIGFHKYYFIFLFFITFIIVGLLTYFDFNIIYRVICSLILLLFVLIYSRKRIKLLGL